MSARVVAVLPGDNFLEGPPASQICKSVDDIREALEVATRLKVCGSQVGYRAAIGAAWQVSIARRLY